MCNNVPSKGLLVSLPSLSSIFDACHLNTRADGPRFSNLSPRGGVGNPGCGTDLKYVSSSSEGYGDREWGTVPENIPNTSKVIQISVHITIWSTIIQVYYVNFRLVYMYNKLLTLWMQAATTLSLIVHRSWSAVVTWEYLVSAQQTTGS
jgi:hypothetical protein